MMSQAQYDARIEERAYMTSRVDELPKGIAQRTPEWYAAREDWSLHLSQSGRQTGAIRPWKTKRQTVFWDRTLLDGVWSMKTSLVLYSYYNNTEVIEYGLLSIQLSPT
jgi:hypothetical protein